MKETDILNKYVKKKKEIVYEKQRQKHYEGRSLEKSEIKVEKLEAQLEKIKQEFLAKTEKGRKIQRRASHKIEQIVPAGAEKPKVSGKTMIYAFVTFRSMEGVEIF